MPKTLLAAALLTAFAVGPVAAQAPPDAKPIVVPFELLPSRHMAVQVKVNDKGPFRLIFDTGAPLTIVNTSVSKKAGLKPKEGGAAGMPFGIAPFGMMGEMGVKKLEVGGAVLADTSAVAIDHPTVAAISEAFGPIEGIVGFPFFARYKMTVDYQKKQLTLVPNGYKPADFLEGMMKTMTAATEQKGEPRVVGASGLWGLTVGKAAAGEGGVEVTAVLPGGAAAAGGLKVGDRLLTIDGRWTDTVADTYLAASLVKPGSGATLYVVRGGEKVKLTVTPTRGF